ncbi:glycosyltransferase family 2 protein [Sporolactobacillus pectinivorans]|uniref:glycosyltransferase family 2 protein n=1 Tax=Sporolactobacillus pectinivorans TaxID=1591408 RepID=UPI000C26ADD7|nr:glycosyltransferase [Sporolactobacillus pectinivorans]
MELSVVTAVYNGEAHLEEAIQGILNQTFHDFEYIIVNDGSSDRTREILDGVIDPRVKVIHLKKNKGAANALNTGIYDASGEWIALQDADDVSMEPRLQKQLTYIKSHPGFAAIGSLIQCIPEDENMDQNFLKMEEFFFNAKEPEKFRDEQFYSTPICHGSGLFSKKAFQNTGGYDPAFKIAYDYDLWSRMFEEGEIGRVPEVLYQYRIQANSLAHMNRIETTSEVLLSTFKSLAKVRFGQLNRKPKLLLLGSQKEIAFYKDKIAPRNHYLKMLFLEQKLSNIKKAYSLYRFSKIDGIVLASNPQMNQTFRFFASRGLSFGRQVFMVWIPDEFS